MHQSCFVVYCNLVVCGSCLELVKEESKLAIVLVIDDDET